MVSIASSSIIGTIIPQNGIPKKYQMEYGEIFYKIFDFINIFDMYHSLWFRLMLFMLVTNIIVCTFNRFYKDWKYVFFKRTYKTSNFRKFSENRNFSTNVDFKKIYELCYSAILSEAGKLKVTKFDKEVVIYSETGRWVKLGVHIVHFSIVLLLIGGLITSIFGFEGYINLTEGDVVNSVKVNKSTKRKDLGFSIKCDSFDIKVYENGMPKEYKSKLTILKDGVSVAEKNIIVNNPMNYNGITIFQSSYGKIPFSLRDKIFLPEKIEMRFTSKLSKKVYIEKLKIGVPFDIPENLGKFVLLDFLTNVTSNGLDLGEVFRGVHFFDANMIFEEVLLPIRFPDYDLMRNKNVVISLSEELCKEIESNIDNRSLYYTGLKVTKDPGKWIVYLGFSFMLLGFIITFFVSHWQINVKVSVNGKNTKVLISGKTNRNRLTMSRRIDRIYNRVSIVDL